MIDLVYPLGFGSLWNNNELRYSLRSVEKFLTGYGNVYIVGERPEWVGNIIHIQADDTGRSRPEMIMRKILKACQEPGLSDNFLFLNDDFFFLQPAEAETMPYLYDCTLAEAIEKKRKGGPYKQALANTQHVLGCNRKPGLHYDIHTPVIYNKREFPRVMNSYNWDRFGMVVKSLYCNSVGVQEEQYPDCKIDQPCETEGQLKALIPDRMLFSVGDNAVNDVFKNYIQKLFPTKSKFEL